VEPECSIASRYTPPICVFITEVHVWTVATINYSVRMAYGRGRLVAIADIPK